MLTFLRVTCLYGVALGFAMLVFHAFTGRIDAWLMPAVFILLRLWFIVIEARRPVMTDADWWKLVASLTPPEKAIRIVGEQRASYRPPRHWTLLLGDVLGMLGLFILPPMLFVMETSEFFTFRQPITVSTTGLFAIGAAIYGLPSTPWCRRSLVVAYGVWLVPLWLLVKPLEELARKKHPYWHPGVPGWRRLGAEKVLSLKDKQLAAQHADWIVSYASSLADRGNKQAAMYLCQQALELDTKLKSARQLMEKLSTSP